MRTVQAGPVAGFVGLLGLLTGLDAFVGVDGPGRAVGIGCAAAVSVLLGRALGQLAVPRLQPSGLGPADWITLLRAELACAVAALAVTAALTGRTGLVVATMVALAVVALVLDGVDGRVARRTGTVSAFGARFDMEVDAFLILVLSAYVAAGTGWWVLLIGGARYLFVAAALVLPWLRGTAPPRPWCKVVAVVQGVVLTAAAAGVLAPGWIRAALLVALALLAESFGHEARDLWRGRVPSRIAPAAWLPEPAARG
jgi:phosphatidylglycerophosphate synthase